MSIKFEVINLSDENQIEEVLSIYKSNKEYFILSGDSNISFKTIQDDFNLIPDGVSRKNKHYMLVRDGNKSIAVFDYISEFPEKEMCYIGFLLVKNDIHRMGYGKKVFNKFEDIIKTQGFKSIRLGVLDNNEKGMHFWNNMGFHKIKTVKSNIRPDKDWTIDVMEKDL